MNISKIKIALLLKSSSREDVQKILQNESFEIESFERARDQVLDDLDSRLRTTRFTKANVPGLQEAVNEVSNADESYIVTNLVISGEYYVIVYTDRELSKIFGIV